MQTHPTPTASSAASSAASSTARAATPHGPLSLDALAARSFSELDALYRGASVSSSMHAADGALVGRMLAVRSLPGAIASPLRRWAASATFSWEGKTFQAANDHTGVGHNRVYIPRVLGHQNLFSFDTRFGASAIDGKPTLVLDYDIASNPAYIRHVHDEIREVSPGLFLGPAMWKSAIAERAAHDDRKTLLLWFALDARLS